MNPPTSWPPFSKHGPSHTSLIIIARAEPHFYLDGRRTTYASAYQQSRSPQWRAEPYSSSASSSTAVAVDERSVLEVYSPQDKVPLCCPRILAIGTNDFEAMHGDRRMHWQRLESTFELNKWECMGCGSTATDADFQGAFAFFSFSLTGRWG